MSLIAWYPLNSNLNDYSGNNNDLIAYSNFIYDEAGKIGGCYRASQTSSYASSKNNLYLNEDISMCVWFKLEAYSTSPTAIITNHDHSSTSNFGINLSGNKIGISIGYTDGTREWSGRNSNTIIELNKWYHVVLTYKKSSKNLKLYVNGVLECNDTLTKEVKALNKPLQINKWSIGYANYTTTGRYNDIRIYDHELSVKEVKEIYKTKILHYKFDDPNEEPTVNKYANVTPGFGGLSSTFGTSSITKIKDGHYKVTINRNLEATGNAWPNVQLPAYSFTANKDYSISIKVKLITKKGNASATVRHSMVSNDCWTSDRKYAGITSLKAGIWHTINLTTNIKASYTNSSGTVVSSSPRIEIYTDIHKPGDYLEFEFKDYQVEEKNHSTPFVNGTRNGIVRDCSGFGNHGTITTSPDYVNDSVIGFGGFKYTAKTSQCINCTEFKNITDAITVCAWAKFEASSSTDRPLVTKTTTTDSSDGWSLWDGYSQDFRWDVGTVSGSHSLSLNGNWRFLVGSYDSTTGVEKLYCDGVLVRTRNKTAGTLIPSNSAPLRVGYAVRGAASMNGTIADVQIYATALSDKDVLDLYQTKASVSKNGKLYVNQIVEKNEQTNLIKPSDIGIGNLSGVTMSITTADSFGRRIIKNTATTSGQFRFYFPLDILTPYVGKNLTFSFNYRFLKGNSFDLTDWCDGTITKIKSNGSIIAQGSRSTYDNTYRFMDATIGADTEVEIWNIRLEQEDISNYKTSIDKKGILTTREVNELDLSGMKVKEELGVKWIRLFYHNNKSGTVFFGSKNEFLKCNTEDKISHLWAMELFRGTDNKFEFLLQYQSGGTSYNRWKQSSNFTKESVAGYEAVSCSWTSNYWGGLEYNGSSSTWADGSVNHGNWFYAIGCRKNYSTGGIPSWNGVEPGWVELWVRCDDLGLFKMIKNGTCKSSEFIEV